MMSSLRMRLLVGTIGGMVLLLLCFGLIVYTAIRRTLLTEFDRSLASTVEILTAGIEVDVNELEMDFEVGQMPQFNDPQHMALYEIWRPDGEVIVRSPLLGSADLPHFHGDPGVPVRRAISDPHSGLPLRAIGVEFAPRTDQKQASGQTRNSQERLLVIVVARDAGALLSRLASLRWLLLGTTGGIAGMALLVGTVVVRRGLRPLQSIAAEIAAVDETSLQARIGSTPAPAEIVPIQDRLNSLLARLKDALDRERRFSANVAHELRNPLAGMRSTMEVTLSRRREPEEYRHALTESLGIVDGMQGMVNNLLLLARMDANQIELRAQSIIISDLVDASWKPFASKATERQVTFENQISDSLVLTSDPQSLSVVFSNLLGNAVEYTDRGGHIWTQAQETDGSIDILVANTGCHLHPDQAGRVFDRFWRADPARSDAGTHCGLGLSLVHRTMRALGGSAAASVEHGTFTLRLTLPAKS